MQWSTAADEKSDLLNGGVKGCRKGNKHFFFLVALRSYY